MSPPRPTASAPPATLRPQLLSWRLTGAFPIQQAGWGAGVPATALQPVLSSRCTSGKLTFGGKQGRALQRGQNLRKTPDPRGRCNTALTHLPGGRASPHVQDWGPGSGSDASRPTDPPRGDPCTDRAGSRLGRTREPQGAACAGFRRPPAAHARERSRSGGAGPPSMRAASQGVP